jgi:protein-S-isoprenylcysteine O-methyltransferase Ste14
MTGAATPNTIPWPPLLYGGAAVAAVALGYFVPAGTVAPGAIAGLGALLMALGLGLDGAAMLTMRRHHANILPHRAATALVTAFPFSVSRNPIYLGAAPAFGNPWFVPLAAAAVWAVTILAIRREEAHLAALFGDAWLAYAARVPRWLRLPQ